MVVGRLGLGGLVEWGVLRVVRDRKDGVNLTHVMNAVAMAVCFLLHVKSRCRLAGELVWLLMLVTRLVVAVRMRGMLCSDSLFVMIDLAVTV